MSDDGGANCFRLPTDAGTDAPTGIPDLPYRTAHGHPLVIERIYLDSFDWRLHTRRRCLYRERRPNGETWALATPKRTLTGQALTPVEPPFHTHRLPENIARRLAGVLDCRTLLPVITTHIKRQPLDCLNAEGKTVVRLEIDRIEIRQGDRGTWRYLDTRCRLLPLKGYEKPAHRLRNHLDRLGATPCGDGILNDGLKRLGIEPGRYSARPRLILDPDMRSDQAMKTVLAALHDVMSQNLDGILDDIDSEFLHDFRTAIRRSRTVLGQLRQVFPARRTERLSAGLTWLGTETTPLRDLDVHLSDFPVYRKRLPKRLRPAFDPLHDRLLARRAGALSRLRKVLNSHRFLHFMQDWKTFLDTPPAPHTRLANARTPVRTTSARRIRKLYERICTEGLAIDEKSPPEALHALRKRCKKLRYLLELFESCLPPPGPAPVIAMLKGLQDLLGGYQDCHVQAEALSGFKTDRDTGTDPRFTAAIDWLLADLDLRQTRLRDSFHATIRDFASAEHRSMVRALTKVD